MSAAGAADGLRAARMRMEARDDSGAPDIPGYVIEGVLGRGATGVVYRARQLSVERLVALKILHPELAGATQAARRLQREAKTTARLAHPNIISAIDMGELRGRCWYAMELIDGQSLAARIHERPLTEREALRLFIPLCDALQHAFERGVVHRDIKPANILLARDGRALIVDLGLAFAEDDPLLTKSGGTLGTPHYISPEQARDPSSADVQSDLWSLGATMYHAVCGRPPFAGESVAEILSAVLYAKVPDPHELAPQLTGGFVLVLRKALARDKRLRYATPAELSADLERLRERRSPHVRRASLEPIARDPRRIWRRAASYAALVAATIAVVATIVALRADEPLSADTGARNGARLREDDALAPIAAAVHGPANRLSGALQELELVRASGIVDPQLSSRADALRDELAQRLETEVWRFKRENEAAIAARLEAREFDAAEASAGDALRDDLVRRVGGVRLPLRTEEEVRVFCAQLTARVQQAREDAEQAFAAGIDRFYTVRILPRVDELQAQNGWREARGLLTFESGEWLARSGASPQGLSSAALERALGGLRTKINARREALDEAWSAVDADLVRWVDERTSALALELERRTRTEAARQLESDWETELAARGLAIDEMPVGLLHLGHEELAKGRRRLVELEERLVREDAQRGLAELEAQALPAWRERRYADAAELFERRLADAWRATVRPQMELRAREARALHALLERAALGARAKDGQAVDLRAGTIALSGRLSVGGDPLVTGVRLVLAGGNTRVLALAAPAPSDLSTTLVAGESVEELSGLGATPPDRLLRALFRFREAGENEHGARSAQEVLNSGPLPREEPLVADVESRVARVLRAWKTAESERAAQARERLFLLRREIGGPLGRDVLRARAEELIASYADAFDAAELADLRRLRDELAAEAQSAGKQDIAAAFGATSVVAIGADRVRLRFDFNAPSAGAFAPGVWIPERGGWTPGRYAKSDEEMLARASPTLPLAEPLRVASDTIAVRLSFEQPPDAPPDLLLVTVAGFHVAIAGARDGRSARCAIDTGDAAELVRRVREGAGRDIAALAAGRAFEIGIVVNRARGSVHVDLDGKRVAGGQRPSPRNDVPSLAVRAFEPVRFLSATIEASVR
ncbi:MAG: protein kinase domain-containing protein [Planctomycetota bacterium]